MSPIGPGRGHFETMELHGDLWRLSGWICHPDLATTAVALSIDGVALCELVPTLREDVARIFDWIPHAGASGFAVEVPRRQGRQQVLVEARQGQRVLTSIRTTIASEFEQLPTPPPALMQRVNGSPDPRFFDADGVRSYTEFFDAVARHRGWQSIPRMLDWGCGCGRVTRCFLRAHPALEVHGCDIDGEAIAWCSEHLSTGSFRTIDPQPPTPYPDAHFPLILGYSVFSLLDPDRQRLWLAELNRLLAPGGLLLASVHGPFAARFAFPKLQPSRGFSWRRRPGTFDVRAKGFIDAGEDVALQGIAPAGYYRGVFQSPAWTRRVWSDYFRVLEILEGGMQNYQDLVILEKR